MNYKIITLPCVSFIQVLKTVKYDSAALHETHCGLPYPRGLLSSSTPTQVIAEANKEVQKAVGTADGGKRGPYKRYSSTLHAEIAKYACQYGTAATTQHYSK